MVNALFKIVKLPPGAKALFVKWVFIYKFDKNNVLFRWKARLVLCSNKQRLDINYGDMFVSVIRPSTFKLLMALIAVYDLKCKYLDVITAFLNGKLDCKNIYIQLLEGYRQYLKDGVVLIGLLLKALYGLKQALRLCQQSGQIIIVYVDDLILIGRDIWTIELLKEAFRNKYKVRDLGPIAYYLGI